MKLRTIGIVLFALAMTWTVWTVLGSSAFGATPTAITSNPPASQEQIQLRELPGIGHGPSGVAIIGDQLYALNAKSFNIAVVKNNRAVKFIPIGERPIGGLASPPLLTADPAQKRLYIANLGSDSIALIENDQLVLTHRIGAEANALLFFENHLFVGLSNYNLILVLDPATLQTQTRIAVPNARTITSLVSDAVHHRIYTALQETIAVIDTTQLRVERTIRVAGVDSSSLVAFVPNDRVLVSLYDSTSDIMWLVALNAASGAQQGRVQVSSNLGATIVNAADSRVYIADSYDNQVEVIDPRTMTSIATIPVDMQPRALALDETAHLLYVANSDSDNLNVINTDDNRVSALIPFATLPTALVANPDAGRVYIANASTDSVFVIQGNRVVKEISVGRYPLDMARDAQANRVLVTNQGDGTLSIIDESDFSVRATKPITSNQATVDIDAAHGRAFFGNTILDLKNYAPIGKLTLQGASQTGSVTEVSAERLRVNPNNNRIYAVAWNGGYGSAGADVVYSIDENTLQQRSILDMRFQDPGVTIDFDPSTNRVFVASTSGQSDHRLGVFDANDKQVTLLMLPASSTGMGYNPQTHHLFLSHPDNTVQILDSDSFGTVAQLNVNAPSALMRLGNSFYIAGLDGQVTLIQDTNAPTPPAPATSTSVPSNTPRAPRSPAPSIQMVPTSAPVLHAGWTSYTNANLGNHAVALDSNGDLWTGSDGGAVHWNLKAGSYIKYAVENGLAFNNITSLGLARDGAVWFGTDGYGVSRFDGKTWKTYTQADGLASNSVHTIAAASDGMVWLGTSSGVSSFDGRAFKTYTKADGVADDLIWSMAIAPDGAVWVGTGGAGVSHFDGKTWTTYNTIDGLADNVVLALAVAPDGTIWFGTDDGVSRWDGHTFKTYTQTEGLASNSISSIVVAANGTVWAGSNQNDTLSQFDGHVWKTFRRADGLVDDAILSLATASDSTVWIGTWYGATRFEGNTWKTITTADGLGGAPPINNMIIPHAIAIAPDGALWFGTDNGVSRFDGKLWKTFTHADGLPDNNVLSLAFAHDGAIWAGTWNGVARFDGSTWKTYSKDNGLPDNYVQNITIAPDSKIWIGTFNGLALFDGTSWKTYTKADGLAGDFASAVAIAPNGQVWVNTTEGLSRFDGMTWKTFTTADGLPDTVVSSIAAASDNAIWLATSIGVVRYDGRSWKTFTTANGLADDFVLSIALAPDGTVWALTNAGVSHFDGKVWKTINTGGMLNQASYMIVAPSGAVWFTSGSSAVRFDANEAR